MEKFRKIKEDLNYVSYELPIYSKRKTVWNVLQSFGEIASFHANVINSGYLNDSEVKIGCERYCEFPSQMGRVPLAKEKIIDLKPEEFYLIDFYEFKNFPMNHMYIQLGLRESFEINNLVYGKCWFQSSPKLFSSLFSGKMKKTLREILLGYKHYIETGERNKEMKQIKKIYSEL